LKLTFSALDQGQTNGKSNNKTVQKPYTLSSKKN